MTYLASTFLPKLEKKAKHIWSLIKPFQQEIYVAVSVLLLAYLVIYLIRKWTRNIPPGPYGLPFVGYLPYLSQDIYFDFNRLAKKYGNVFSLKLGNVDVVVLNGVEAIREAFSKAEFLGRPEYSTLQTALKNSPFFVGDQRRWQEHRRFVVQTLKDLGLGKTQIEVDIHDEIDCFLKVLESHQGQLMDPRTPLSPSMSNNICALVFGKRLEYDDSLRKKLDFNLDIVTEAVSQASGPTFFTWTRYFRPLLKLLPKLKEGIKAISRVEEILNQEVEQHKKTLDPRHPRDLIDRYLIEVGERKVKDPNTTLSVEMINAVVLDLFAAGSETVRTSIHWFIYIIAAHQDVQKKVQAEIQDVIGTERKPEYLDQKCMPYTHAVILEMMRWKTLVPINVLRSAVADTSVMGYDVPKDTIVLANLWAVHNDPKLWKNPEKFVPERFLSPDGKKVMKSNNLMPFSVGKRSCPGENMAMMEMFLYFTAVLQKFDVLLPEGEKPSYPYTFTTVYRRSNYKARFIARK